jgi:hypothetical protein
LQRLTGLLLHRVRHRHLLILLERLRYPLRL